MDPVDNSICRANSLNNLVELSSLFDIIKGERLHQSSIVFFYRP